MAEAKITPAQGRLLRFLVHNGFTRVLSGQEWATMERLVEKGLATAERDERGSYWLPTKAGREAAGR